MQEHDKIERAEEIYSFHSLEEQKRFNKIVQELRCTVCQNQSLADSLAPLALDLKSVIYQKIRSQQYSEQQIVEFITQRYGNFVLYDPPVESSTLLLWFGPISILIFGLLMAKRYIKINSPLQ